MPKVPRPAAPSASPLRRLAAALVLAGVLLGAGACAPQGGAAFGPAFPPAPGGFLPPPSPFGAVAPTRVGLLLPLSGPQAPLGQSLLNAATLALFDGAGPGVEFLPRDTGGSAGGAAEAAREALAQGARVVVGPLTGAETGGAAGQARAAGVPVFAFTNDATTAGQGVWALGVTPAQQVRRLVASAASGGVRRVGLAAPEGPFARQLAAALREASAQAGLAPPLVVTYPAGAARLQAAGQFAAQAGGGPPGLILLGETGGGAREMAAALAAAGLVPPPRIAGHAQWATDASLAAEPALAGALVPGPDPAARASFESRYQAAFGERPPRLAAVAYDAAAVALRSLGPGGASAGAPARPPVGEVLGGADGALRLLPDGTAQRALGLYALEPGGEPRLVEPALLPGLAGS